MLSVLILLLIIATICFGLVVFFGAPYLPTLRKQQITALELLDLKSGQTLLELGSGDGRILKAAARKGIKAIGYEINPILVIISKIYCYKYRRLVEIHWANFWKINFPDTDAVYVFLLQKYMESLYTKITQEISREVKLVSFAFDIESQKPFNQKDGLYVYKIKPSSRQVS